ncbi:MAG: MerR family DNA-binding transcriptional regulator [Alphaproteobacteria bacterium]|jgi:DNA-binding transcriptional MerR regulator|nr:MerR family DNA-binding transcriptional regulator [Alphaproteobacteria bacterium]
MNETYGIAALAREFDVTTRTIRFYEDKGLLSPARQGQRRIYAPRDRVRLRLIMRGKRLGFSLDEIRQLIDLYDVDPTEEIQLRHFLEKIRERKSALVLQQADIIETLEEIQRIEVQCSALLSNKQKK